MRTGRTTCTLAVSALLVVVAGCSGGSEDRASGDASTSPDAAASSPAESPSSASTAPAPTEPYTGYPDSIAVIGHSGVTGENTDPYEGSDTKTNSWATGTNPAVDSVYLRLVAKNPAAEGHAENYAFGGATVSDMLGQAAGIVSSEPRPDLVLFSGIDNDIVCPATEADYQSFGEGLTKILDLLDREAPATRVMVFSQLGRPRHYAESLTPAQRKAVGGTGPCAFVDPQGRIVERELVRLTSIIRGYEHAAEEVCAKFERCTYDDGAFASVVDRPGDFGDDLNHLSIAGHARTAAVAWKALQKVGLMPAK